MKCHVCRDREAELTTWWERLRNWKFRKLNSILFTQDFEDLKSEKYTQGYSDGYTDGAEKEHQHQMDLQKKYGI
jgi:hypothetical protein